MLVRRTENDFIPYNSLYSVGFGLTDTMKVPRPCAFKSLNMTGVDYYRGQNAYAYTIPEALTPVAASMNHRSVQMV